MYHARMAAPNRTMLALGTPAPAFRLTDFNGKVCTLEDFAAARGLVVAFICNHCPYVKHMRNEFARFAREYQPKGIAVVAICSNDTDAYPQDGPKAWPRKRAAPVTRFLICSMRRRASRRRTTPRARPICTCSTRSASSSTAGSSTTAGPAAARRAGKDLRAACDALLNGAADAVEAEAEPRLQHQVERLTFAYHR